MCERTPQDMDVKTERIPRAPRYRGPGISFRGKATRLGYGEAAEWARSYREPVVGRAGRMADGGKIKLQ